MMLSEASLTGIADFDLLLEVRVVREDLHARFCVRVVRRLELKVLHSKLLEERV